MHFEILVEDQSGKKMLDILFPKIITNGNTLKVISYKGIGRIPKNLDKKTNKANRALLNSLPELLAGYGRTYVGRSYPIAIIVVCDLDDRKLDEFKRELSDVLDACNPRPNAYFCMAVEEGEAWLLGDISAIKRAYPQAKDQVLIDYENDSICGTWECLADAIFPKGSSALKKRGYPEIGSIKVEWAEKITPHMDVQNNASPSFNDFLSQIQELIDKP